MTFRSRSNKYGAKRTSVDGVIFHSKKEAMRYVALKQMLKSGKIKDLELQPRVPIYINGKKICDYVGDFRYVDSSGFTVLEDVKSEATKTPVYRLKKKMLEAQDPPVKITEFM